MKNKMKRLNLILKNKGYNKENRLMLKMYLAIVLLGLKIPEASNYFKIPEIKVRAALTFCGVKLQKDKNFHAAMYDVFNAYKSQTELNLVA